MTDEVDKSEEHTGKERVDVPVDPDSPAEREGNDDAVVAPEPVPAPPAEDEDGA
jgi:hypothetical protein